MKKLISVIIVIALTLIMVGCGEKELTINDYNEKELANGEWVIAKYIGYTNDTTNAKIIGRVEMNHEVYNFYCTSEPTLTLYSIVEVYFSINEEVLAIREAL